MQVGFFRHVKCRIMTKKSDGWGGPWTEKKLEAFGKYVSAYLKILKSQPQWKTIYFDGFAGSGERKKPSNNEASKLYAQLLLTKQEEEVYKGAAERVLTLPNNLLFDFHYFIDSSQDSLDKLKKKLDALPNSKKTKLNFKKGDCNKWLGDLSKALKTNKYAALVLLDPFGMQIDWSSIADLKGTRSDIWILVPTGVIINRLLYRSGKLEHLEKLQSFFGLSEDEIKNEFYKTGVTPTLFGGEEEIVTKIVNPIGHIMNLYIRQLKTIWKHVTEQPLRLDNTRGNPLFHLVFASNKATALKIAKQIIKDQ
jgi:three-Cys-motif partner protein